jgi:hypothetical protein
LAGAFSGMRLLQTPPEWYEHNVKASLGSGGITLSQDILEFGNGYAAGVAYCFSKAR